MSIAESMLPEFDVEIANTRKVLEQLPQDQLTYRPHEKSYSLGELATHVTNLLSWVQHTMKQDGFDIDSKNPPPSPPEVGSAQDALKTFDANAAAARAAIAGASDETMLGTWRFSRDGQTMMEMPRTAVMRSFILNHLIHHRAQLGVYLRLTGAKVPSIYGPSADDTGI
jgi:uncharacterized damage-inducible protein DinB